MCTAAGSSRSQPQSELSLHINCITCFAVFTLLLYIEVLHSLQSGLLAERLTCESQPILGGGGGSGPACLVNFLTVYTDDIMHADDLCMVKPI